MLSFSATGVKHISALFYIYINLTVLNLCCSLVFQATLSTLKFQMPGQEPVLHAKDVGEVLKYTLLLILWNFDSLIYNLRLTDWEHHK